MNQRLKSHQNRKHSEAINYAVPDCSAVRFNPRGSFNRDHDDEAINCPSPTPGAEIKCSAWATWSAGYAMPRLSCNGSPGTGTLAALRCSYMCVFYWERHRNLMFMWGKLATSVLIYNVAVMWSFVCLWLEREISNQIVVYEVFFSTHLLIFPLTYWIL